MLSKEIKEANTLQRVRTSLECYLIIRLRIRLTIVNPRATNRIDWINPGCYAILDVPYGEHSLHRRGLCSWINPGCYAILDVPYGEHSLHRRGLCS
ncbi:hypothetical protein CDAR_229621 [Caerostris darwini]|uniref:Uncharacterized protein n=1 Tax=Caerostris darwini TaxID=1538125 RepID=A0AAV4Q0W9_9ARAC|nr:hypothetical protein CDAR_229621 [Caerostris darwini]